MLEGGMKLATAGAVMGMAAAYIRARKVTTMAKVNAPTAPKPKKVVHPVVPAIHHYVLWKFKENASASSIEAAVTAAEAVVGAIPGVLSAKVTTLDNNARAKGFTHQYLVVLGSPAALAGFGTHAVHKSLVVDHIKPIIEDLLIYDVSATLANGRLAGKAALVTGASSGIGKEVALAFAREGCDVAINYPTGNAEQQANAEAVAAEVELLGRRALVVAADITSEAEVTAMVESVLSGFGKIDVLVNNAGIATASFVEEMPPDMWDTMIRVNMRGVYLCTRAVLPHMYARDSGRIINTASQLAYLGAPTFSHYCATKGAILSFTRSPSGGDPSPPARQIARVRILFRGE